VQEWGKGKGGGGRKKKKGTRKDRESHHLLPPLRDEPLQTREIYKEGITVSTGACPVV